MIKTTFFQLIFLILLSYIESSTDPEAACPADPAVAIPQGTVLGLLDSSEKGISFKSFRGVPFGKVEQRFQRAVKASPFENGSFSAKQEGPRCPQLPLRDDMSEDCLSVNVFVPNEGKNFPVMVWIHGGAFVRGSGGKFYYGPEYLVDYGVIVVTLNYRLGQFGFLSLENEEVPGNMAFWDQNLALEWVNENIEHFGGDKARITIFGESAGSFSVMYHLVSPKSSGLFSAAIAQSGAPFSTFYGPQSPGHARRVALDLASHLGCESGEDKVIMNCLNDKSVEEILNQSIFCDECNKDITCIDQDEHICTVTAWNSVMDGAFASDPFLPDFPTNLVQNGKHNKVPVIVGVTSEEGIYSSSKYIKDPETFSEFNKYWDTYGPLYLFDKSDNVTDTERSVSSQVRSFYLGEEDASMENIHSIINFFSDDIFWSGAHQYIRLAIDQQSAPIYHYILTYKASNSFSDLVLSLDSEKLGLGVCHADDVYHLFKNHVHQMTFNEDDIFVRESMLTWWTNFAKSHSPDDDELWKRIGSDSHMYLNISTSPHMEYNQNYAKRMDFWTQIIEKMKY